MNRMRLAMLSLNRESFWSPFVISVVMVPMTYADMHMFINIITMVNDLSVGFRGDISP